MKRKTSSHQLASKLGISRARGLEAVLKAKLIRAVISAMVKQKLSHAELAARSGIPRSAVTGILSGSLQKVSIERVLRLIDAVELTAEIRIKDAA